MKDGMQEATMMQGQTLSRGFSLAVMAVTALVLAAMSLAPQASLYAG